MSTGDLVRKALYKPLHAGNHKVSRRELKQAIKASVNAQTSGVGIAAGKALTQAETTRALRQLLDDFGSVAMQDGFTGISLRDIDIWYSTEAGE